MHPESSPDSVISWRIGELEKASKEMRGDLKEAVGQLGGALTALQTQLISYQSNISEKYVTRRDFEAFVRRSDERADEQSEWGWKALSLACSAAAVLIAGAAWLHPFGH